MTQQHQQSRTRSRSSRRKKAIVNQLRWAGYAVAGAATAFSGTPAAEADIHYFPNVNKLVQDDPYTTDGVADMESIALAGNAKIMFRHQHVGDGGGNAFATASNGTFNSIAAFYSSGYGGSGSSSSKFVDNLPYGQFISGLSTFFAKSSAGTMARAFSYGPFNSPGEGFLAFQFDVGNGTQYGWARVETLDTFGIQFNDFRIVDYAYADPNQSLKVGEIPEPGSLGLLAIGAAGLLTWRRQRKSARSAA
ncbi:MAG: PEP-CTERM sorting domain-containing protein [Pirellulaceae bacterium]